MTLPEPIAVVGIGCRFAGGATDAEALWELVRDGTDLVTELPEDRRDAFSGGRADVDIATFRGSYLGRVDGFDADFFGISPREGREMDPQQRLLLETSWEAIEDAGLQAERLAGTRTGVFVGMLGFDYSLLHTKQAGLDRIDQYYASGKEFSFGTGRLSFFLDVRGPSMTVNTACSSSLVAIHLASQSLRTGESDLALAGGVSLVLSPELTLYLDRAGAISSTGRCRVFDARADGIVRGEGSGMLALKRLADAQADGDRIHAVIRGSAVSHDGNSAGLTVPSATAQQAVIEAALAQGGVSADEVSMIEAHGTGTPLGDPIEVGGLRATFGDRGPEDPLWLGSLKTNLGHTDAAAGVGSAIKAIQAIRHRTVAPHLHLDEPNPVIPWKRVPFVIPSEATPWDRGDRPLVAGVSAFGLSGTNAHLVISEPPAADGTDGTDGTPTSLPEDRETVLVPISARHPEALDELVGGYRDRLASAADPGATEHTRAINDLARSAGTRRSHHPYRAAVVGSDPDEMAEALREMGDGPSPDAVRSRSEPEAAGSQPVFVFSGQGCQWPGMAERLWAEEPTFRELLATCDEVVRDEAGWSLLDAMGQEQALQRTDLAQPAIASMQIALTGLWGSWGVRPAALVGHSVGELAGSYAAGSLELEAVVRLAVRRGWAMHEAGHGGGMVAVEATADDLGDAVAEAGEDVVIGAFNGPRSVVLSGARASLEPLVEDLRERGVRCQWLPVDYSFHHPRLEDAGRALTDELRDLVVREPTVRVVPSSDVAPEEAELFQPAYWGVGLSRQVRFAEAVQTLAADGHRLFLEIGPHPTLRRPLSDCFDDVEGTGTLVSSLRRRRGGRDQLLSSLARLYVAGVDPDWDAVQPAGRTIDLPRYPWRHQSLWFTAGMASNGQPPSGARAADVPADQADAAADVPAAQADAAADGPEGQAAAMPAPRSPGEFAESLQRCVSHVLGFDEPGQVSRRRGFFDLGMDSVAAVELRDMIAEYIGVELSATSVFDYPTVERLAAHVAEEAGRQGLPPATGDVRAPSADTEPQGADERPATVVPRPAETPGAGASDDRVAVVGVGCRFPGGAVGPAAFWELLRRGDDAVTGIPSDRWDPDDLVARIPRAPAGDGLRFGAFLEDVEGFDNAFFRIPPREARVMDPQQRLFLEVAWEALEQGGHTPEQLAQGNTGVFVGANTNDYLQLLTRDLAGIDQYYGTGNSFCAAPGRLSYLLGLQGPSMAVDTACSSSLVAVHLACQSLLQGESDVAIAGGVNVMLMPTVHLSAMDAGALAPDGRCKTFDARADGYGRGEGCGVVVLKPLRRALDDGDRVLAVLAGSAVNQDGASSGLTVPNGAAQAALIERALAEARISPHDVTYLEAHGTGTPLGDPIEAHAAGRALARDTGAPRPLLLGSVKSNIGHLEAASGIAGLIKTVLAVGERELPASLHFSSPSPQIDWDRYDIAVNTELTPWEGERLVAGVSAFGFSGTNAHVIVEQPPAPTRHNGEQPHDLPEVLVLSAMSRDALQEQARRHLGTLAHTSEQPDVRDLCFTANVRRPRHDHRLAVVGRSADELAEGLEAYLEDETSKRVRIGSAAGDEDPPVVFVFSGYGGQWAGMGTGLLKESPAFASALTRIDDALRAHQDWSVVEAIVRLAEEGTKKLGAVPQELLFAVQVAIFETWAALGVSPDAIIGHSVGEVAAAHCAGALSLEQAAAVIHHRTEEIEKLLGGGGMGIVGLSRGETERLIAGRADELCVAVENSPTSTVVSGDAAALDELLEEVRDRNVFCRRLRADGAGHSPQVEPLRAQLVAKLDGLSPSATRTPLWSAVAGGEIEGSELDAEFWGRNIREPVRFAPALRQLAEQGYRLYVEIGPSPVLANAVEETARDAGVEAQVFASMSKRKESGALLPSLGGLHAAGHPVDLACLYPTGAIVDLPTYPWRHETHRARAGRLSDTSAGVAGDPVGHPLLQRRSDSTDRGGTIVWEADLDPDTLSFLDAGATDGLPVVTPGVYLEMASAAVAAIEGPGHAMRRIELGEPLTLRDGVRATLRLSFDTAGEGWAFRLSSVERLDGAPLPVVTERCRGEVAPEDTSQRLWLEDLASTGGDARWPEADTDEDGVDETERPLRTERRGDQIALCLEQPHRRQARLYSVHPLLTDEAVRQLGATTDGQAGAPTPRFIDCVRVLADGRPHTDVLLHASASGQGAPSGLDGALISSDSGAPLLELSGVQFEPSESSAPPQDAGEESGSLADDVYALAWQEVTDGAGRAGGVAPAGGDESAEEARPDAYILVTGDNPVGAELGSLLEAEGRTCVVLRSGSASGATPQGPAIDMRDPDALGQAVLDSLSRDPEATWRVVSLLALDDTPDAPAEARAAALHVTQALRSPRPPIDARLHLVTRGAQPLPGRRARVDHTRSALWGLGRIIGLEDPGGWGGLVDLDPAPATGARASAALLLAELSRPDREDHVMLRGDRRLVARVRPHPAAVSAGPVREGGVHLVVANSHAGRSVADWLEGRGAKAVVVLVPRGHEAQALVPDGATGDPDQVGEGVTYLTCDLTAREEIGEAIAACRRLGDLQGVFHALTDWTTSSLMGATASGLDDGLRLRGLSAAHLDELTRDQAPDHFVLFSTAASMWGSIGFGVSAVADQALDALARNRRARGLAALSVGWVPWVETLDDDSREMMERSGLRPYGASEALSALESLLASGSGPVVAVADVDWQTHRPLYEAQRPWPLLSECGDASSAATVDGSTGWLAAELAEAARTERGGLLTDRLTTVVATTLGYDDATQVEADRGFFELGMNSVMALELKVALETALGAELPSTLAFEYPTTASLVRFVAEDVLGTAVPVAGAASNGGGPPAEAADDDDLSRAPSANGQAGDDHSDPVDAPTEDHDTEDLLAELDREIAASAELLGETDRQG